ncbi:MAG TPA: menaquinone biosynthesis protein [Flavisolibacter sp.]|nr:menaquinone biosynthesis protein [Flavisolibacter sp.]
MKKIRVAAVSYLNTKPLLYGIKRHPVMEQIELIEDYPSKIAQMLVDDKVDMGLIPVAASLKLKTWNIVGNYCIGCEGEVASVCIFSDVPLDQVENIYLDYQSRTSVNLARLLLKEYWKINVSFIDAKGEDFRNQIKGTTAGVVIGDRALEQRLRSSYIYDLGEAWKKYTGFPFVFAAWIANKELPGSFKKAFDDANAIGLDHIDEIIKENPFPQFDLKEYFTHYISYQLTEEKKKGLDLFLQKLPQYMIL